MSRPVIAYSCSDLTFSTTAASSKVLQRDLATWMTSKVLTSLTSHAPRTYGLDGNFHWFFEPTGITLIAIGSGACPIVIPRRSLKSIISRLWRIRAPQQRKRLRVGSQIDECSLPAPMNGRIALKRQRKEILCKMPRTLCVLEAGLVVIERHLVNRV